MLYSPTVRHRRPLGGLCGVVLVLVSVLPAGADSGMRTVTDSKGRVTISVPADWDVFSLGANVLAGKMRKDVPEDLFSMIVAMAPRPPEHLPALTVVTIKLPGEISGRALTSAALGATPTKKMSDLGYNVVQEGSTTIAGHQAYFMYATKTLASTDMLVTAGHLPPGQSVYLVFALFGEGGLGIFATGYTVNEPTRVRTDFATISRILETVRFTGKPSAQPSPLPRIVVSTPAGASN